MKAHTFYSCISLFAYVYRKIFTCRLSHVDAVFNCSSLYMLMFLSTIYAELEINKSA